eukprot:c28532_g1_i3 orf=383-1780(+)
MPPLNQWRKLKCAVQSVSVQLENQSTRRVGKCYPFCQRPPFDCLSASPVFCTRSSKVVDCAFWQGKPLTVSEAVSRVLAIPSVYGPAWHCCSYHSCQLLVDKTESVWGKPFVDWKITSVIGNPSRYRERKFESKLPSKWALGGKSEEASLFLFNSLTGGKEWKEGRFGKAVNKDTGVLGHELLFGIHLRTINWKAGGRNKHWFDNTKAAYHNTSQLLCFYGASIASRFFKSRSGLRAIGELFAKEVQDVSYSGATFALSGFVLHHSQEDDLSEDGQSHIDRNLNSSELRLVSGACCLPHPEKEITGGEDAYFICADQQAVGVADGVGGWAMEGIDAGQYARELMSQSMKAVLQEPHGLINPARVLTTAHSKTTCRGSSTACILAFSNHRLQAVNLGDSGFIIVRNGRKIFKSPVQQHQFNVPFQLENGGSDPPSAAEISEHFKLFSSQSFYKDNCQLSIRRTIGI